MSAREYLYGLVVLFGAACSGLSPISSLPREDEVPGLQPRLPPLASAGADREVLRGCATRLHGLGSYHPQGRAFFLRWEQLEGEPVHLSNVADPCPAFVAPLDEQVLVFRLWAEDADWYTSDEVRLFVVKQPHAGSPEVRAGPDRTLRALEEAEPTEVEIAYVEPAGAETSWGRVTAGAVERSSSRAVTAAPVDVSIFRLTATAGGLESAPDYVLLWGQDPTGAIRTGPRIQVTGVGVATPGVEVKLVAQPEEDLGVESLHWRWEQSQGEALLLAPHAEAELSLFAPAQIGTLSFLVHASDGQLSSAPAWISVRVDADNASVAPPQPVPPLEQRIHLGGAVWLDALAGAEEEPAPEVSFRWEQSFGSPMLELVFDGSRYALVRLAESGLSELALPVELGCAVVASLEGGESAPAVTRLTVTATIDNLAPQITLCASSAEPVVGETVVVSARVIDPEADRLKVVTWTQDPAQTVVMDPLTESSSSNLEPACTFPAGRPSGAEAPYELREHVSFAAPDATLRVGLTACDALGACNSAHVDLEAVKAQAVP